MDEKKEIRQQVNKILGRELSDAEFQGIDFSGIIEDLEPDFDDFETIVLYLSCDVVRGRNCVCPSGCRNPRPSCLLWY